MKTVLLKEVLCQISNGVNCVQNKDGNGDKITRIETISDGKINLNRVGYCSLDQKQKEKYRLRRGDILFSHINSPIHVGKTAVINEDLDLYHGVNLLLLRSTKVIPQYIELYLKFLKQTGYWARTSKQAVNQASVNQQDIKKLPFSYPESTVEQERIVRKLDEAFEKIDKAKANTEKNLENTQELFNNRLNGLFTDNRWVKVRLSDIAEYFNGLTYSPKDVNGTGTIVLRSSNVQNDELDFSDIVRVSRPIKEKIMVKSSDILMCSRNGSKRLIGKTATIKNLKEPMTFGTFMMIIRGKYNAYLSWFFKSSEFRKQMVRGESNSINQITRYMLDDVLLPFPTPKGQTEVVKELDELSAQIKKLQELYQKKLEALEELRQSILKQAFEGKL